MKLGPFDVSGSYTGDCRELLAKLPDGCAQTCVTSPPYWGLRDYGVDGQLGMEATPDEYVANMVDVFREVRRVLRDDGTTWLNLGDSYVSNVRGNGGAESSTLTGSPNSQRRQEKWQRTAIARERVDGLKTKDIVGIPWLVAFALRADGWYLRSDIIWHKPNPMPESVTDRPTKAHEYIFLLSKSERYYYDADAVAEPSLFGGEQLGIVRGQKRRATAMGVVPSGNERPGADATIAQTRNKRSVWTVATQPYDEAHFAVFPPKLIEPCILAGSRPGDVVLDPFFGSGTTGKVAEDNGRLWLGFDLNPAYKALQDKRTAQRGLCFKP